MDEIKNILLATLDRNDIKMLFYGSNNVSSSMSAVIFNSATEYNLTT